MSLATIIRDTDLTAQSFDASVLDVPDRDDYVEVVQESFCLACLACQAPVAAFESWGGELMHYVGDPMTDNIMPNEIDHAPLLP
jgi:hypothetical protein